MAKVFHVITPEEERTRITNSIYHPQSLDNEGFIHFSKADQIETVIDNFYSHFQQLILWRVPENKLGEKLVYEPPIEAPNSGIKFPHLYSEMSTHIVEKKFFLKKNNLGKFLIPSDLLI